MEKEDKFVVETTLNYFTICNKPYFYGYLSDY